MEQNDVNNTLFDAYRCHEDIEDWMYDKFLILELN